MIRFDQKTCTNLHSAIEREWLETNGLGGYASSTIANLNTRRYHGLLVAATKPPVGRLVMLSKLEETLIIDGQRYELSTNQYPGAIHPRGFEYQVEFRLDPFPVFTYHIEGIEIEKSLFMIHSENTTIIQYKFRQANNTSSFILSPSSFFQVAPLIAFRDYHSLTHENEALNPRFEIQENLLTIKPYADTPALHFAHDAEVFEAAGYWHRNLEYKVENERGFDFREDLFCPVIFKANLDARPHFNLIASTERRDVSRASDYRETEVERRRKSIAAAIHAFTSHPNKFITALVAAIDAYIVARGNQKTIIAGYPWFGDWGRDTMIALPGLTLITDRADVARSILLEFSRYVDQGMLPNRFPDAGETPEYNTVDATLWFFEAVRALIDYTEDHEFVRANLYNVLTDMIAWHVRGTRYGIHMCEDGLLTAGASGVQLTWMDAKVGDWVVTPRAGKPVEIQALWYNALRIMEGLADKFNDAANQKRYAEMAERARASFNELFWNEERNCLYDVIDGESPDASIRPNQIFAVSLTHSMLSPEKSRRVVETVERDLLTPYGLRSLAPDDPHYRPHYAGDPLSRDGAYHQGTVWAWLMGPFITAYIKTYDYDPEARERAKKWLNDLQTHLSEAAGLGHISEVFDGDPPHTPGGCVAQAWSVAELLRAAVEDVYKLRPKRAGKPLPNETAVTLTATRQQAPHRPL